LEINNTMKQNGKSASVTENRVQRNSFSVQHAEIEDFISRKPPLFVRYGTIAFLVLLTGIAVICWLIQYPDIIITNAKLKSDFLPPKIVSASAGEKQSTYPGNLTADTISADTSYFMETLIPQYDFGKVKKGQDVILKFQAYPAEQFGSVKGKIQAISPKTTDSGFLVRIQLPEGLTTNTGAKIPLTVGLIAEADIITANKRLLERFYYKAVQK
jgi:HlyD family secretion protein